MTSNELWNGFYLVGSGGSITSGTAHLVDASGGTGVKYETQVFAKGGDIIEFTAMARTVSGIGHLYCDVGTSPVYLGDVDVTGHDDWRAYTLKCVIPIHYNTAPLKIGVGIYTADVGDVYFRLPTIKVNGKEPTAKTIQAGLRAGPGNDDLYVVTDGKDVCRVHTDGTFAFNNPDAASFPIDPLASAVDGMSISSGSSPGVIRSYHANYDAAVWGRGSVGVVHRFLYVTGPSVSTGVGNINITTTATNYQTTSDYRVKSNQADLTTSGEFIDALRPKTWTWAIDGSQGVGFIAHELQAVSPTSVSGVKDAVDAEGNPEYQGVAYGSAELIANMVAELKSLRQRVAALESK